MRQLSVLILLVLAGCIPAVVGDSPGTSVKTLERNLFEVKAIQGPTVVIGSSKHIERWLGPCQAQPTPLDALEPPNADGKPVVLALVCDAPSTITLSTTGRLTARLSSAPR
jgi:hypothetical protein